MIEVSDSGVGIPTEARRHGVRAVLHHQGSGKGTGQGLAIARTIVVDRHGGDISFQTELGRGTTFTVRLPLEPPTP